MLWTYQRGSEMLRVDTRFANDADEYVLIVYRDDGVSLLRDGWKI